MNGCVFCGIAAGRVEASIVFEDDWSIAFMDLRQPNAGHVLVVPRQHVQEICDLEPSVGVRLMEAVIETARAVRSAFRPEGLSIWQSNGEAAGQEVPHVHFHVLARWTGDELLRVYPRKPPYPSRGELDEMACRIRTRQEHYGIPDTKR